MWTNIIYLFSCILAVVVLIAAGSVADICMTRAKARQAVISSSDRQLIEGLLSTAKRLDSRLTAVERAVLDHEMSVPNGTEV